MKTQTRTAIRYYAHMLRVMLWENTPDKGIIHYSNPKDCSQLWCDGGSCVMDLQPTEIFVDYGIDEDRARELLVGMLKQRIETLQLEKRN